VDKKSNTKQFNSFDKFFYIFPFLKIFEKKLCLKNVHKKLPAKSTLNDNERNKIILYVLNGMSPKGT